MMQLLCITRRQTRWGSVAHIHYTELRAEFSLTQISWQTKPWAFALVRLTWHVLVRPSLTGKIRGRIQIHSLKHRSTEGLSEWKFRPFCTRGWTSKSAVKTLSFILSARQPSFLLTRFHWIKKSSMFRAFRCQVNLALCIIFNVRKLLHPFKHAYKRSNILKFLALDPFDFIIVRSGNSFAKESAQLVRILHEIYSSFGLN